MDTILEVRGLNKHFGGIRAVGSFDLSVDRGEIIGLIGPNGAGKTTFFNLLTGFLKPDSGDVFLQGIKITKLKPHKIANLGMARTFQIVKPFKQMLVVENVAVAGLSERAQKKRNGGDVLSKTLECLRRVDIIPPVANMFKLSSELSHGYSKRLDIARAIALEPEILLLDEPFGGLGLKETPIMTSVIKRLHEEGLTMIIIEHKMRELGKLAQRLVVMNFGEKIAEGSPKDVSMNQRVCEAYLGKERGKFFA